MYSNEELFNGIKDGKISLSDLKEWSDNVFTKVRDDYEKRKGNADGKAKDLQAQLETLQKAHDALGESSQREKADLTKIIDDLRGQIRNVESLHNQELSGQINNLTVERDKYKADYDKLAAEYQNAKLLNVARNITAQLKLKNAEYAAQDLIRDKILTIGDDGKYKLNFNYFDDKTQGQLVSTANGTDDNLQPLIDDIKILATNKKTSYSRFGELYPEMVNVHQGSGSLGNGSANNGGDKSLLDEYRDLNQKN